jgi:hypothetical protein
MKNNVNKELFESKVGYDWKIKMMLCRVAPSLFHIVENSPYDSNKSWANVVRLMFLTEGKNLNELNVSINGYYNSIKRALKEIDVIRYEGKTLVKGSNWDRMYSDEDWSWFKLNTDSFGHSIVIK